MKEDECGDDLTFPNVIAMYIAVTILTIFVLWPVEMWRCLRRKARA